MAVFSKIKKALKNIKLPSGNKVSTEPIDDGHSYAYSAAMNMFNAFELYASNLTLDNYEEIEAKNPKINSNFRNRRIGMLSFGWKVEPATSEEIDKEVASFVKYVLKNIKVQTLEHSLRWLMYAIRDEFELLQIIPKYIKTGPWAGKVGLKWLMPINRMQAEPVLINKELISFNICNKNYDAENFLVYTHEPTANKPMGTSLFIPLIWYHWFFKNGMGFWSAHLDRFGTPIAIAKVEGTLSAEEKVELEKAVENINSGYSVRVPKGVIIDILTAASSGKTGFKDYINFCGDMCVEILVGQTLATGTSEFSTRAQSVVHKQILSEYNQVDGQEISGAVQRQLIPLLVEWNYPGRGYPEFSIITEKPEDQDKKSDRIHTAFLDGLPIKKVEAYEAHGLTVPEEGDDVIVFQQGSGRPPPPPGEEDDDDNSDSFSETRNNPRTNIGLEDTEGFIHKYSENYKKVTAKLPELIMGALDRASRGLQPEPVDDKKKK
jgi:phage gp29-like protein